MRRPAATERLYLDFDSFFASVEQQARPELRGRPVGVLPIDSPNTCIIAASREAKAFGIRTGTPIREARRLCPDITCIVARPDIYARLNRRIVETVASVAPIIGVRSIDELVADVAGWRSEEALARARAIKARLAEAVGPFITCSIGIASNEPLAKVAAEMCKPDGLFLLAPDALPGPLLALSLTDFPGIASGVSRRLEACGISSVADLWAASPKHLRAIWGSVEGERFWAGLHGYAIERPETQRRMFGHSRVLAPDWRGSERARACARLLLIKAARRLRREHYAARALTLSLSGGHGAAPWAREMRFQPCTDDQSFLTRLDEVWPQIWPMRGARPVFKIVSVMLHGLVPASGGERDLFESQSEARGRLRREALSGVLDGLNRRFGREIVTIGPRLDLPGGFAGAKIAFGRIPHAEDF